MPWNTNPKASALKFPRRSELKPVKNTPSDESQDDASLTVLRALEPYPEARQAVVRALYQELGYEYLEDDIE